MPSYFEITPFITKLQPGQENSIFSNSDHDLGQTDMAIVLDAPPGHVEHLCQVILKSNEK